MQSVDNIESNQIPLKLVSEKPPSSNLVLVEEKRNVKEENIPLELDKEKSIFFFSKRYFFLKIIYFFYNFFVSIIFYIFLVYLLNYLELYKKKNRIKNYYKILEIPENASDSQIKKAYRRLSLKWHPDKNLNNRNEAEEKFKEIKRANAVLTGREEEEVQNYILTKDGFFNIGKQLVFFYLLLFIFDFIYCFVYYLINKVKTFKNYVFWKFIYFIICLFYLTVMRKNYLEILSFFLFFFPLDLGYYYSEFFKKEKKIDGEIIETNEN